MNPKEISDFVEGHYKVAKGRRALTSEEVENIKNLIQQQGRLEFRILANPVDDGDAIKRAETYLKNPDNAGTLAHLEVLGERRPPPLPEGGGKDFPVTLNGETINYSYSWVEVGKEELYSLHLNNPRNVANPARIAAAWKADWEAVAAVRDKEAIRYPLQGGGRFLLYSRDIKTRSRLSPKDIQQGKDYEYFILTRNSEPGKEITGDYLSQAVSGPSSRGEPAVHFGFNNEGGNLFYELTSLNKPAKSEGSFERQLAIVLDDQIRAAPGLRSAIRDRGEISGGFTQKTVQELVTILRAVRLPATLKQNPVSENSMGPTLGSDTIFKGTLSVGIAFLAVLLFMLFYYRFAGIVACIALLANLVLTVAFMVLVNATFTLPGLAGLVLMLGMAVDANVLIYERLREERERGASLALAIRNGYDRAFPTIIDTHLSSIFTAIVLYVVGNDQLKGFGISLTVGLIISLFTSLFMTRTMFDFWLTKNWLHTLSIEANLFHRPNIDFMAIRYYWFTATILLTVVGAALFICAPQSGRAWRQRHEHRLHRRHRLHRQARQAVDHHRAAREARNEPAKGRRVARPVDRADLFDRRHGREKLSLHRPHGGQGPAQGAADHQHPPGRCPAVHRAAQLHDRPEQQDGESGVHQAELGRRGLRFPRPGDQAAARGKGSRCNFRVEPLGNEVEWPVLEDEGRADRPD